MVNLGEALIIGPLLRVTLVCFRHDRRKFFYFLAASLAQGNHNLKKNRDDDVAFLGPLRRVTLDFLPRVLGMVF